MSFVIVRITRGIFRAGVFDYREIMVSSIINHSERHGPGRVHCCRAVWIRYLEIGEGMTTRSFDKSLSGTTYKRKKLK